DPEAQEKCLFALSNLLFQRRKYALAIMRLEEALSAYPDGADSVRARFQLAECHRLQAEQEERALASGETMSQLAKDHHEMLRRKHLEDAVVNYLELQEALTRRQQAAPLRLEEENYLRQVLFLLPFCRSNQGDYNEALRAYNELSRRYTNKPESL